MTVPVPDDLSITFTPSDLARMVKQKFVQQHYDELAREAATAEKRDFDRNVGGGTDRDKIPDEDFAGKDRSFPIVSQGDVSDALESIGRAGSGNYDSGTLRSNILRIARRKGFSVPDDDHSQNKGAGEVTEQGAEVAEKAEAPEETETATPDVTKDPAPEPVKKAKKKPRPKKLPPWLNKPSMTRVTATTRRAPPVTPGRASPPRTTCGPGSRAPPASCAPSAAPRPPRLPG